MTQEVHIILTGEFDAELSKEQLKSYVQNILSRTLSGLKVADVKEEAEIYETEDDKVFNAVLAKNQIAKQMANYMQDGINVEQVMSCLGDIEKVIGTANQPSAEDTFNNPN